MRVVQMWMRVWRLSWHCNTLQHNATHYNTHIATHRLHAGGTDVNVHMTIFITLQHTATHCNTLQHTATHRLHAGGADVNARMTIVDKSFSSYYKAEEHGDEGESGTGRGGGVQYRNCVWELCVCYGVAMISWLLKIIGLFCKRAI